MDVYYKKTSGLLIELPVVSTSGFTSRIENIGSISNKGIEFRSNAKLIETKDFNWSFRGNISRNINKILKLGVESFTVNDRSIKVGQPLGVFSGYVFDGVVQQGEENATPVPVWETDGVQAGEARYKDINGDEIINGSDRVNLGNVHPDFI